MHALFNSYKQMGATADVINGIARYTYDMWEWYERNGTVLFSMCGEQDNGEWIMGDDEELTGLYVRDDADITLMDDDNNVIATLNDDTLIAYIIANAA